MHQGGKYQIRLQLLQALDDAVPRSRAAHSDYQLSIWVLQQVACITQDGGWQRFVMACNSLVVGNKTQQLPATRLNQVDVGYQLRYFPGVATSAKDDQVVHVLGRRQGMALRKMRWRSPIWYEGS